MTERNAQPKVENTTKGNATDKVETNRFSQHRLATNRNTIEQSSLSANHNRGEVSTGEYPTDENRGVIRTTNVGDIRNIPTKNDISTENNEKQIHLKQADNGIKPKERMNMTQMKNIITPTQNSMPTWARAWNAIMQTDWVQQTIYNHNERWYNKKWSLTRVRQ